MADIKVSALPTLTVAVDEDVLIVNDVSTGSTKKITRGNLLSHIAKNFEDSASGVVLPTGDLTLANELIAGGDISTSGTVSFGNLRDYVQDITITRFIDSAGAFQDSADWDTTIPTTLAIRNYVAEVDSSVKEFMPELSKLDHFSQVMENQGAFTTFDQDMLILIIAFWFGQRSRSRAIGSK